MATKLKTKNIVDLSKYTSSKHLSIGDAKKSSMPIKYVMGQDGIYKVRQNDLGEFIVKASKVDSADKIQEGFKLNMPKIPYDMLLKTVTFFRHVMDKFNGSEAIVQFFWDKSNKEYIIHVPEQEVGGASCTYKANKEIESKHLLVLDIHSHNTMSAHFSNTDNNDDKESRVFGVIGKLNEKYPEYKFRVGVCGQYLNIDVEDIFDVPSTETSIPSSWIKKVSKFKPKTSKAKKVPLTGTNNLEWFNGVKYVDSDYKDTEDTPDYSSSTGANGILQHIITKLDNDEIIYLIKTLALSGYDDLIEEGYFEAELDLNEGGDNNGDGI